MELSSDSLTLVKLLIVACCALTGGLLYIAFTPKEASELPPEKTVEETLDLKTSETEGNPSAVGELTQSLLEAPVANVRQQFKYWHLCWLVPTTMLLVANLVLPSGQDEADQQCDSSHWGPMIPAVSWLYLPAFGKGLEIRDSVRADFGQLLYFRFFGRPLPEVTMPTMQTIMTKAQLRERTIFFIPNYAVLIALAMLLLEAMRFGCLHADVLKKWYPEQKTLQKSTTVAKKKQQEREYHYMDGGASLSDAALSGSDWSSDVSSDVLSKMLNKDDNVVVERTLEESFQFRVYTRVFLGWYVSYQLFLYAWVDVTVAGGLMNKATGAAYEMWSLAVQLELLVHIISAALWYSFTLGQAHQMPTPLVLPSMMPWIGNAVHIYKDHMAQGLCFAMAHCSQGYLSWAGLALGYLGFAATMWPLVPLLRDPKCCEGLRAAHWPVVEAGAKQASPGTWRAWVMSSACNFCTREKEVRALNGEIPHAVLHGLFVFFFGGSTFIWLGMFISLVKIASIPFLRRLLIQPFIGKWGCSHDSCRKFLVNEQGDPRLVYRLVKENNWFDIQEEWFPNKGDYDKVLGPFPMITEFVDKSGNHLGASDIQMERQGVIKREARDMTLLLGGLDLKTVKQDLNVAEDVPFTQLVISVGVNSDAGNNGLGIYVTNSARQNLKMCFHPGMYSGQLRVEGAGGFSNQNVGFTPKPWSDERALQMFDFVLNSNGENEIRFGPWSKTWTNSIFDGHRTPSIWGHSDKQAMLYFGPVTLSLKI